MGCDSGTEEKGCRAQGRDCLVHITICFAANNADERKPRRASPQGGRLRQGEDDEEQHQELGVPEVVLEQSPGEHGRDRRESGRGEGAGRIVA